MGGRGRVREGVGEVGSGTGWERVGTGSGRGWEWVWDRVREGVDRERDRVREGLGVSRVRRGWEWVGTGSGNGMGRVREGGGRG